MLVIVTYITCGPKTDKRGSFKEAVMATEHVFKVVRKERKTSTEKQTCTFSPAGDSREERSWASQVPLSSFTNISRVTPGAFQVLCFLA